MADGIITVGAPLLAASLTRSPLLIALVTAAVTTPWLLLALHAGAVADRADRRRIILAAAVTRALTLAAAAVLGALGLLSLPLLYLVVLVIGCAEVFADTSAQAMVPMTVPRERLGAANGRLTAAETVGDAFLGAPIAGVLLGITASAVFAVPALLYAVAVLCLLGLRGRFKAERTAAPRPIRAEIASGLGYLRGHRLLRDLAVFSGLWNFAGTAYMAVIVLWVVGPQSRIGLTEAAFGLVAVTLAAGAVTGSLITERLAAAVGETRVLAVVNVLGALAMFVPVLWPAVWTLFPAAVVMGATGAMANVLVVSLRQRLIPDHLLGRVNSAYRLLGEGATPLGAAAGGVLGNLAGLPVLFATAATGCLFAGLFVATRVTAATVAAHEPTPIPDPS